MRDFIEALQLVVIVLVFSHPLITAILAALAGSWIIAEISIACDKRAERRVEAAKLADRQRRIGERHEHKNNLGD